MQWRNFNVLDPMQGSQGPHPLGAEAQIIDKRQYRKYTHRHGQRAAHRGAVHPERPREK